jgi:phage/plasmid-like protein (TIGR03299 family)
MAHELEIVNGQAQMAYAGDVPWHGLGIQVSNDLTPMQMMEKAGLDWTVEKMPTFIEVDGKKISTGLNALVRSTDKKVLTQVGDGWNPVQNEEAFQFFSEFVLSGDMEMNTAGSLKGGRVVWALAKVKESFDIFGGDQVDSYLLFSNPHQYGKCIDIRFTPIRVVCNNTLTFSLERQADVSYRANHSSKFDGDKVKQAMGLAHEKFAQYKQMAEYLGSKRVTTESLIEYYSTVFPKTSGNTEVENVEDLSRNARLAYEALETQPGAEYAEGSWWQAFNSVTYITDHVQGRNADNRVYNSWFGSNQTRKVRALNKAMEMAEAA